MLFIEVAIAGLMRALRRFFGNTRILTVVLEFPDLPPLNAATRDYIDRLTANPVPLEFGSLSHYIKDQSHGREHLGGSTVVYLGAVLPPWHDVFVPPTEPGLPPEQTGTTSLDTTTVVAAHLGKTLLYYDIVFLCHGGLLPWNATAAPRSYTLTSRFVFFTWRHTIKLPTVNIGLPVLEHRMTSTLCHELMHALGVSDHAPYLEGEEGSSSTATQRNPWHSVSNSGEWGQTIPDFNTLAVGVSAYNANRFGWYKGSDCLSLTAPVNHQPVQLRTTALAPDDGPAGSVSFIEIDATTLMNHPEGYVFEARAKVGYDANLFDSGVLIHKVDYLYNVSSVGALPFLLGPLPPPRPVMTGHWPSYVLKSGETFNRPGLEVTVTDVIMDDSGTPQVFVLDITVQ